MSSPFDEIELRERAIRNYGAFFARFGRKPGGAHATLEGVTRYRSGLFLAPFNGAFAAEPRAPASSAVLDRVLAGFSDRKLPFFWWTFPGWDPPETLRALEERGLEQGWVVPGMALDTAIAPTPRLPEVPLRIAPVESEEDRRAFVATVNASDFQMTEEAMIPVGDLLLPDPGDTTYRAFLGHVEGRPVGTSIRFTAHGVIGLYGIGTIPDLRRQGVGAAMTRAAIDDGRVGGLRYATLGASEMGEPLYRQLGFQEFGRISAWIGNPQFSRSSEYRRRPATE